MIGELDDDTLSDTPAHAEAAARILTAAAKRIRDGHSVRDVAAIWLTL